MSEKRLDELIGLLANARPRLNNVTRARVVASIAGTPPTTPIERPGRRARWIAKLVSTAGHGRRARWIVAAAAIAALLLYSGAREGAPDPRVMRAVEPSIAHMRAEQESIARIGADQRASEPSSFAAAPESAPDTIAPATHSTTYKLNDATVTVYGAGSAILQDARIVSDADVFTFDRAAGAAAVEVSIRGATIFVQHATFAVDSGAVLRVTIIRGEILLQCANANQGLQVKAGEVVSCDLNRTERAGAPPVGGASSAPPPARSTRTKVAASAAPSTTLRPAPADPAPAPTKLTPPHEPSVTTMTTLPRAAVDHEPSKPTSPGAPGSAASAPGASSDAAVEASVAPRRGALDASIAARYLAAERLLASNPAAARAALTALVTEAPNAVETAPAWLDLARLAARDGNAVAARAALDRLAVHPGAPALAMPATFLRCMIERAWPALRRCLTEFRVAFPGSPRDAEVLARLATATFAIGDCPAARQLVAEYLRRYPKGPAIAALEASSARCGSARRP